MRIVRIGIRRLLLVMALTPPVASLPSTVNPAPLSASMPRHVIRTPIAALASDDDVYSGAAADTDCWTASSMAMIILNAPLRPTPLFNTLWGVAKYRICADGAANRLRNLNERNDSSSQQHRQQQAMRLVPDLIIGDLDSITDETKAYYSDVRTVQVIDQDRNDLDKALEAAASYRRVVVFGAFGGRFDQQMGSVQSLYCYPDREIFLYDDTSMAVLVPAGETSLFLAVGATTTKCAVSEGPSCGLIPIGQPVRAMTTTGLQWNLNEQGMHFGGLVSTSNRVTDQEVTIVSSEPFLFTAELHCGSATEWSEPT
jgi:thiamine pyrophosphokinase